jgi:hypothetical protein
MGILTGSFPPETVDELIAVHGVREQRRRELPADVMVYFTIAMWLWRGSGYVEVLKQMTDALRVASWRGPETEWMAEVPNSSSITKARKRISWQVMEDLFRSSIGPVADADTGETWQGLAPVALDGATLDLPDTAGNRGYFGGPAGGALPQARFVAACEIATRRLIGAAVGPYGRSEKALTLNMIDALGPGQVAIFDRGFCGYDLFGAVCGTGAEVIMRAGSQFKLRPVEVLADGSWIANLNKPGKRSIRVRVIEYSVTSTDTVTGETSVGETVTLITSLLDHEAYPIEDFPDLYRQRWTSETIYDEVKTDLRGGTDVVFRSTSPDGVLAEFWGLMCLYQGISDVVDHVVLDAGLPPGDAVSFKAATSFVRRSVTWTDAAISP